MAKTKHDEVLEIQPDGWEKVIACFKSKAAAEHKAMLKRNSASLKRRKDNIVVREVVT